MLQVPWTRTTRFWGTTHHIGIAWVVLSNIILTISHHQANMLELQLQVKHYLSQWRPSSHRVPSQSRSRESTKAKWVRINRSQHTNQEPQRAVTEANMASLGSLREQIPKASILESPRKLPRTSLVHWNHPCRSHWCRETGLHPNSIRIWHSLSTLGSLVCKPNTLPTPRSRISNSHQQAPKTPKIRLASAQLKEIKLFLRRVKHPEEALLREERSGIQEWGLHLRTSMATLLPRKHKDMAITTVIPASSQPLLITSSPRRLLDRWSLSGSGNSANCNAIAIT